MKSRADAVDARFILIAVLICYTTGCSTPSTDKPELAPVPEGKYRIQSGDILSKIAQRENGNGNLWYVLLNANPDLKSRPKFALYAGEVITLPPKEQIDRRLPKSEYPKELPAKYVIMPGDRLSTIAKECYGDADLWTKIYEANKQTLSERFCRIQPLSAPVKLLRFPPNPNGICIFVSPTVSIDGCRGRPFQSEQLAHLTVCQLGCFRSQAKYG